MENILKWEFLVCCERGNMDLLKEVHEKVPDIPTKIKQEGFDMACISGHHDTVKYILEKLDTGDIDRDMGMRLATKNAKTNIVELLLKDAVRRNPNW